MSALQTKRIVIGLLAVSLYCSGTGRPSRGNGFYGRCQDVSM